MEAEDRRLMRGVIDGDDVETNRAVWRELALAKEVVGGADEDLMLGAGDAELGQRVLMVGGSAGADFNEDEAGAIEGDQVDLALVVVVHVIACDEDVAEVAEIPVGVGFAASADQASGLLGVTGKFGKAVAVAAFQHGKTEMAKQVHNEITIRYW